MDVNLSIRSLFRLQLQPQVWETVYKNPCNILNTLPYSMALVFTHSRVAIEPWQLLGMGCRQEELFSSSNSSILYMKCFYELTHLLLSTQDRLGAKSVYPPFYF